MWNPLRVPQSIVPSSGIEPASPALRAGAITRSATRACCGRGGARPRASSTIRLSGSCFVAQRNRSGTRTRTSIDRVKTCGPAFGRSPIGYVPGRGFEPRSLRSERSGLPLADPESGKRGLAGSRTPFARVRTECFAVKASSPRVRASRWVPPVGLEPTQSGLKGRCPTSWATAARSGRRLVFECGSDRTRTCDGRQAQTGLRPASFAARMHAPRSRSRDSFPFARLTSRNEKSRRGFPGRLHIELSIQFVFNRPSKQPARDPGTYGNKGSSRSTSTRADSRRSDRCSPSADQRDRP